MKRYALGFLAIVVAAAATASPALAALRSPQINFAEAQLQADLNSIGESIAVEADQEAVPSWATTVSGNAVLTIMFELGGNATLNEMGIAKLDLTGTSVLPLDALIPVFPASAEKDWFAVVSISASGAVTVNLFNASAAHQSTTFGTGVERKSFGYYVKNGADTFYSLDGENPGDRAHALAYKGTGQNAGCWWLCWENSPIEDYLSEDFADATIFMETLNPTPVSKTSWGDLKSRFR